MNNKFEVSVIIPVFNRELYIEQAIMSANVLEEVSEIVIIDDGSTDNTLNICNNLSKKYNKIKVYQHPDKKNHGVSASRNLGIKMATCNYIAFLDSDDIYLDNRFTNDKKIFSSNQNIDGVYNALGIKYYTKEGEELFRKQGFKYQEFLTINGHVPPEELFFVLFNDHSKFKGEFSPVTVTLKKEVFKKSGTFNINLRQKEDIHLWRRMAAVCKLSASNIETAVALRGVHANNTMTNPAIQPNVYDFWWKDLNVWFKKHNIQKSYMDCFKKKYYKYKIRTYPKFKKIPLFLKHYTINLSQIKHMYQDFDMDFFQVFGKNYFTTHIISFKNKMIRKSLAHKC